MKKQTLVFLLVSIVIACHGADQKTTFDSSMYKSFLSALKVYFKPPKDTATKKGKIFTLDTISVAGAGSLKCLRDKNIVVYGDYVFVEFSKEDFTKVIEYQKSLKKPNTKDTASPMILYIKGNPMYDIPVSSLDASSHRFIFYLDRHSKSLMMFYPLFKYINSKIQVSLSVGFKNGVHVLNDEAGKTTLKYMTDWALWLTIIIVAVILAIFFILSKNTTLLRIGKTKETQFSLALSQLLFWTILITMSYFYIWISTQDQAEISGSTLILLAVSMTTIVGAKIVDKRRNVPVEALKNSTDFFTDILSDEEGISLHRCQMVLWTLIVGSIFIVNVIKDQQIPQIDSGLLGLMGISSLGYLGLKNYEKKPDLVTP
jgi:hypothetical protein